MLVVMFVFFLVCLAASVSAVSCPALSSDGSFVPVSYHVSYWSTGATNSTKLAVFFPGYSVLLDDSQVWVKALTEVKLIEHTRHVFTTAGPEDPLFKKEEIDTALLASCVAARLTTGTELVVFAHSSGAFVAYSFLANLFKLGPRRASATFYCLDGGVLGFTMDILSNLTRVLAVNARDSVSGIKVCEASIGFLFFFFC